MHDGSKIISEVEYSFSSYLKFEFKFFFVSSTKVWKQLHVKICDYMHFMLLNEIPQQTCFKKYHYKQTHELEVILVFINFIFPLLINLIWIDLNFNKSQMKNC